MPLELSPPRVMQPRKTGSNPLLHCVTASKILCGPGRQAPVALPAQGWAEAAAFEPLQGLLGGDGLGLRV